MNSPNLIIKYSQKYGYIAGRAEIHNLLARLGDQKEEQELIIPGIIGVKTSLNPRRVVEEITEIHLAEPNSLNATIAWVPADYWCEASVESIQSTIKEEVAMLPDDQYTVEIILNNNKLEKEKLEDALKKVIKAKYSPVPKKIIRIEIFDKQAAITVLKPREEFKAQNF